MVVWALAVAALSHPNEAITRRIASFDLADLTTPALDAPTRTLIKRRSASRYLLPHAELPDESPPGIELRWKLKTIKLKMPLPSI